MQDKNIVNIFPLKSQLLEFKIEDIQLIHEAYYLPQEEGKYQQYLSTTTLITPKPNQRYELLIGFDFRISNDIETVFHLCVGSRFEINRISPSEDFEPLIKVIFGFLENVYSSRTKDHYFNKIPIQEPNYKLINDDIHIKIKACLN